MARSGWRPNHETIRHDLQAGCWYGFQSFHFVEPIPVIKVHFILSFPGLSGDAEQEDGDIQDEDEHGDPNAPFFELGVDGFVFVHRDAIRAGESGLVEAAPAAGFA